MKSFIGEYPNVLSQKDCNTIISYYESRSDKSPGTVVTASDGYSVDKTKKDSMDIGVDAYDDSIEINSVILTSIEKGLNEYKKEYDVVDTLEPWMLMEGYNVQKYLPNQAYFSEHCENSGFTNGTMLVWMIYLNTVTDGGGTRFKYQDVTVKAEEGKLVLWPAFYTHVHCGVVSPSQTKYIATGWFRYRENVPSIIERVLGA